jgi:hypothetical protein
MPRFSEQPWPLSARGAHPNRATFAERLCACHRVPSSEFSAFAWRIGASWPTRCLRPLILHVAPRCFEAEAVFLDAVAQCRGRWELAQEVALLRVSFLRRGCWRHFGIGLDGPRLRRCHDDLVVREISGSGSTPAGRVNPRLGK